MDCGSSYDAPPATSGNSKERSQQGLLRDHRERNVPRGAEGRAPTATHQRDLAE